jgi:2Fe-2S ferredoxin
LIKLNITDRNGESHQVEAPLGDSLMEVLREYDWGVAAICGGMCSCGTCHVFLAPGWPDRFPPQDVDEEDLVDMLEFKQDNSRLSCQLTLGPEHDGLAVLLAPDE